MNSGQSEFTCLATLTFGTERIYTRKTFYSRDIISYLLFSWFFPRNKTAHMYRPAERVTMPCAAGVVYARQSYEGLLGLL